MTCGCGCDGLCLLCCLVPDDLPAGFTAAKWFNFVLFILSAVLTWALRDKGDSLLEDLPELKDCRVDDNGTAVDVDDEVSSNTDDESTCMGKGAVLRVSFASFVYHFAQFLLLIQCKSTADPRTVFHTGGLGLKLFLRVGLIVVSFFLPNGFFGVYGQLARVASGFFLIFQAVVIIDVIYNVNEALLEREWYAVLISSTTVLYSLSLAMVALSYHFYAPRASCSTNVGWITWTLITGVIISAISVSKWRAETAGLLTSGAVFAYASFLLVSALNSEPTDDSNPCVEGDGMGDTWVQVVSFVIAVGAVMISTLSAGTHEVLSSESGDEGLPYRPDVFHLIFSLASMYLAMLFTNWSISETPDEWVVDKGWQSAWVRIASQWLVVLLYIWTMLAPALFKDRVFYKS